MEKNYKSKEEDDVLDKRLKELLNLLADDEYNTSSELAEALNISEKTVRTRIKELNYVLKKNGAIVRSKPRYGYIIVVLDAEVYKIFLASEYQIKDETIPSTSEERVQYLTAYLLNNDEYIKLEDLSKFLFISKKSLTSDLKKVESLLNDYEVRIIRKPNFGIKALGTEFNKRLCIANYLMKCDSIELLDNRIEPVDLMKINEILIEIINKHELRFSELSFHNFCIHIDVAIKRIKKEQRIIFLNENKISLFSKDEYQIAKEIAARLEQVFSITFIESEVQYIAIHLAVKREQLNVVISQKISDLVSLMLTEVYKNFRLDFHENLDLKMMLGQHMAALDVRMQYNMNLKNPLLKEIKEKYAYAYMIAVQACNALTKYYKKRISEDEISYFALYFQMAVDNKKRHIDKKNILIVCASGKGSAQFLLHKYEKEFGQYVDKMQTCDLYRLSNIDFTNIDYVISTVPIKDKIPVPILEVKYFLEDEDVHQVKNVLKSGNKDFLSLYYKEEVFLNNVPGESKEEVIDYICKNIEKKKKISPDFYDQVLKREQLEFTDYGNYVALPHPYEPCSEETFVCVGILEKPILWARNKVQVVLLTAIADKENEFLQDFYQYTMAFTQNQKAIIKLLKKRDFITFMELVKECNGEV